MLSYIFILIGIVILNKLSERHASPKVSTYRPVIQDSLIFVGTNNVTALLSTAWTDVRDSSFQTLQYIIDTGSMSSFIMQRCVSFGDPVSVLSHLDFRIDTAQAIVTGVIITATVKPQVGEHLLLVIDAIILNKLSNFVLTESFSCQQWSHIN